MDASKEIPYTPEDALDLVKNSTIFDQFITDTLNDFDNFEQTRKETQEKN
jgi:hypothetical protein